MSKVVGIYVIIGGILLGAPAAFILYLYMREVLDGDTGTSGFLALLVFIGLSATTIGIGALVIITGEILEAIRAKDPAAAQTARSQPSTAPPTSPPVTPTPREPSRRERDMADKIRRNSSL